MSILEDIRSELRKLLDERSKHQETIDAVLASAEARGDGRLDSDEEPKFAEARDAIKALDPQIDELRSRDDEITDLEARNTDREALAKKLQPEPTPEAERQVRVNKDEPTYRKGGRHSFFQDAYAARFGGATSEVAERLQRHANEVRLGEHGEVRDVGTGAFGALVVPQYLPDMFAENLRAGRVTANLCNGLPLPPEGMTLNIPRGTTATVVASQSDQNTAVTEVDFDETTLTINVRTLAGQQDVSRQAVERGHNVDTILYADLAGGYSVTLDSQVINGAGTNGTHTGILATSSIGSVTTGTATAQSILAKIGQALSVVNGARFLPADVIVMHPRRWGFLTTAADSQGRPLVVPRAGGPSNAFGVGEAAAYGFVGEIHGVPVYTDANIPTTISTSTITGATEDNIIIARRSDLLLWEDDPAPRQFRFEETLGGSLTIKLVVAGDSAFTAGWYPAGVAVVSGSGMTTPTFP